MGRFSNSKEQKWIVSGGNQEATIFLPRELAAVRYFQQVRFVTRAPNAFAVAYKRLEWDRSVAYGKECPSTGRVSFPISKRLFFLEVSTI